MSLVTTTDGKQFDPENTAMFIGWNEDGTVAYFEVRFDSCVYRQHLQYTDGKLASVLKWVRYQ